jgi:predicted MFS family arabinose efflux permease
MIGLSFYMRSSTLPKDAVSGDQPIFARPDAALLKLGLISFCCMAAEGTMFDWSGVYFQKVVKAPPSLVTLGYASFMGTMAIGRFIGDRLVLKFGKKEILKASGITIAVGLLSAVVFPNIYICW